MRSGLELHHGLEMVAGDALEIGGVIVGGEGVLLPAEAGDGLRERADRVLLGALEHEVFEEMRDAGLSDRIIGRTIAVPHHVGHHRGAVIGHHHDVEAVIEGEGGDFGTTCLGPAEGRGLGPARMAVAAVEREPGRILPQQMHRLFLDTSATRDRPS